MMQINFANSKLPGVVNKSRDAFLQFLRDGVSITISFSFNANPQAFSPQNKSIDCGIWFLPANKATIEAIEAMPDWEQLELKPFKRVGNRSLSDAFNQFLFMWTNPLVNMDKINEQLKSEFGSYVSSCMKQLQARGKGHGAQASFPFF